MRPLLSTAPRRDFTMPGAERSKRLGPVSFVDELWLRLSSDTLGVRSGDGSVREDEAKTDDERTGGVLLGLVCELREALVISLA